MNGIITGLLLILGPLIALFLGCWGLEMIEEDILGWLLVSVGVGYPPGAIIFYWRNRRRH